MLRFSLTLLLTIAVTHGISFLPFIHKKQVAEESLILSHVLFRHGNRTPDASELYPKDPYLNVTYFPIGLGELTNAGKVKEYSIGTVLRERYSDFLGPYYYPGIIEARSTNFNRTKASLQLVLASLFAPKNSQIWRRSLDWQPVPYDYVPLSHDKILYGTSCPKYLELFDSNEKSTEQQEEFKKYQRIFEFLSNNTGLNVTSFNNVYSLYFALSTEEEWGFELPEWTADVWPETITDIAIKQYGVNTKTTDLKRLASGYFIKKIITDTQTKINNINEPNGIKMHLYSAHESNIGNLLNTLDIFEYPHIPTYGSYIIFEVHNINDTYSFKILYQNYSTNNPQVLQLPGCDIFCPLEQFISLTAEYIPDEDLCGI